MVNFCFRIVYKTQMQEYIKANVFEHLYIHCMMCYLFVLGLQHIQMNMLAFFFYKKMYTT